MPYKCGYLPTQGHLKARKVSKRRVEQAWEIKDLSYQEKLKKIKLKTLERKKKFSKCLRALTIDIEKKFFTLANSRERYYTRGH